MALRLVTAPVREPVTVEEVRAHLRLDGAPDAQDKLLDIFIASARARAETACNRALVTQTWDLALDQFQWEIPVPKPRLQSVTYIKYVDTDGVLQTLDAAEYLVDSMSEPARITPAFSRVWPVTRAQMNAVTVRYVCGYGTTSRDVPQGIRNWMLVRIADLWLNRSSVSVEAEGRLIELPPMMIDGLLDAYRSESFAWAVSC